MNNSTIAQSFTRGIRLFTAATLLTLLTSLLAAPQPARAGSYEVTKTIDNDETGSLRWAINQANSSLGPDTITFDPAINGMTITLAGTVGEDANAGGDLDILDAGDLTIQGNGAGITIIDGGGIDRVFHVCPGGGCANTVTFTGVTIQNGSAVIAGGGIGGGILNEAGTMIVDSSKVSANKAEIGGGIYNYVGTMTVTGSTVSANTATDGGGGILNRATLIVQNGSTIGGTGAGNTVTSVVGGFLRWGGSTTVDGSADTFGGGILNKSGTTTVEGSTVSANGADWGGGIYNHTGTTTVDSSTISANKAYGGGGIYNEAILKVQNGSTIGGAGTANAANEGGGILNKSGTTTVDGSTVSANGADWGGGIYNEDKLNVQNGSTIGPANTAASGGGGIYNFNGRTTVTGSRILNNTAVEGGGVYNNEAIAGATGVKSSCIVGNSDNSFFNNQIEQQIATDNWWGAAGGPNTAGADTTGGDVNTGGYKTTPILNCGPDLKVNKGNDTGGSGMIGTPFNWTLTISNIGLSSATFDAGQTILVDDLPAGPTYGDTAVGSFVDITNSDKIQCSLADNTITCAATGGDVTFGPLTGSFEVTISVTPDAPATLVNPDTAGICKVDPGGKVLENDESNNDCPENVVTVDAPDLQVGKANDTGGNGKVGTPFQWILTISNSGVYSATFDAGQRILVDDLPTGPTYGAPVVSSFVDVDNSDNILCSLAGNTLTCTAADGDVTLEAETGSFEVILSVKPSAPVTLVNPAGVCQVDPDGNVTENDENNNCPQNVVNILPNILYLPVVLK